MFIKPVLKFIKLFIWLLYNYSENNNLTFNYREVLEPLEPPMDPPLSPTQPIKLLPLFLATVLTNKLVILTIKILQCKLIILR